MSTAMKALTPAAGEGYELPVIQGVDAYGSGGGTSLKFSVISSDRHIASIHARLNIDQAVALMRGTRQALLAEAGEEDSAEARVVTRVRAVRREKRWIARRPTTCTSSPKPRTDRWCCGSAARKRPSSPR